MSYYLAKSYVFFSFLLNSTDFNPSPALYLQDLDLEDEIPLKKVDYSLLEPYHRNDIETKKRREEIKAQVLYETKGFCKEGGEGDGY